MGNSDTSTIAQGNRYALQLIKGYDLMRQPFHAIALFDSEKFQDIKGNIGENWVDIDRKCIILLKGQGHEIPDAAMQYALYKFQTEYCI